MSDWTEEYLLQYLYTFVVTPSAGVGGYIGVEVSGE